MNNYCGNCGSYIGDKNYCPNCGTKRVADGEENLNVIQKSEQENRVKNSNSTVRTACIAITIFAFVVVVILGVIGYFKNNEAEEKQISSEVQTENKIIDNTGDKTREYVVPAGYFNNINWDLTLDQLEETGYFKVTLRKADEVALHKSRIEGLSGLPTKINLLVNSDLKAMAYFITMEKYEGVIEELKNCFTFSFEQDTRDGTNLYIGSDDDMIAGIYEYDDSVRLIVSDKNKYITDEWRVSDLTWGSKPEEYTRFSIRYEKKSDYGSDSVYKSNNTKFYDIYEGSFVVHYVYNDEGLHAAYLDIPYTEALFEKCKVFFDSKEFHIGDIFPSGTGRYAELGATKNAKVIFEHIKSENVIRISCCESGSLYIP